LGAGGAGVARSNWTKPGARLGLDTAVFIYYLNRQEPYFSLCQGILKRIENGEAHGVISTVSEMEMLVQPLAANDKPVIEAIHDLLDTLEHLDIVPVDRQLARNAAQVRAQTRLRNIDALIVATAIVSGCDALVGNDETCARRVREIRYIYLDDAVKEGTP